MRTKGLILAGLFAAMTAICAYINVPLFFTPVPINLATAGALLAGALLGTKLGALSELIYMLLGAIGLPVFSGFTGGIGILAGPTGGFIAGYVLCAAICGLPARKKGLTKTAALMVSGMLACYACGLLWFMFVTRSTLWAGLVACVFPFIPGDAAKIALCCIIANRLSG